MTPLMTRSAMILGLLLMAFTRPERAPDFVLSDLDGGLFKLSEHLSKGPILINFWATWCVPCHAEMRKLKEIHERYASRGLTILAIAIDDPKTVGKVKSFVNTNRYPFQFLLDTDNKVFKLYQGSNPPLSVLLDKAGEIVYTHTGYRKGDEKKLAEQIVRLLPPE